MTRLLRILKELTIGILLGLLAIFVYSFAKPYLFQGLAYFEIQLPFTATQEPLVKPATTLDQQSSINQKANELQLAAGSKLIPPLDLATPGQPLYIVIKSNGKVGGTAGPLPYGPKECAERIRVMEEARQTALGTHRKADGSILTAKEYLDIDQLAFSCEVHQVRPVMELP